METEKEAIAYYIYKDGGNLGPFTKDQLREQQLTPDTYIWHEGLTDWVYAKELEDLKDLFSKKIIPFLNPPATSSGASNTTSGSKSNLLWGGALTLSLLAGGVGYYSQHRQLTAVEQQTGTNPQILLQIDSLQTMNGQLQQELQQKTNELKSIKSDYLDELRKSYDNAFSLLMSETQKLQKIQEFQLFRSSSERQEQIDAQQAVIDKYQEEVARLKDLINSND